MHKLEELKMMLVEELEHFADAGEIKKAELPTIDTLAHAAKNLCKIIEAEDDGYSRRSYGRSYEGEPYNSDVYEGGSRARGGMSRADYSYRRKRDSMGRYSRAEGDTSSMAEELRGIMRGATDESTRYKLQQLVDKVENM